MKHLYSLLFVIACLTSCSSVKKSTTSLLNGNYDDAIYTSIDKLRKNPSKKKGQSHILLLEEAFAKATTRDLQRIKFLAKEGNPNGLDEIYRLYQDLNKRQQSIKPLLPLRLTDPSREAVFDIKNYDDELISYKEQLTEHLYAEATTNLEVAKSKKEYRDIYRNLERVQSLSPNYKEVAALLENTHLKGTDFIEVALYNDSNVIIPRTLQDDLLDFSTYGLNDFWKVYHSTPQEGINYDYVMDVSLREINISPERINERELIKEKSIKDGTEYLKDKEGEYVLDEDGEKIEVDKFIDVTCQYFESLQSKAVNIIGQVRYNSKKTGQLIKAFPLASEFVFEHYYATYDGDRRALDDDLLGYTRNRAIPFPTNEQMVYDVGEDLKQRLKTIILNSKL